MGGVYWGGIAAIGALYALFLGIGWFAARKSRDGSASDLILAGRAMPLWIATLTMTATWVDGGYILGTAQNTGESLAKGVQGGLCFGISLILGGIFFAKKMRELRVHDAGRSVSSPIRAPLGGGARTAGHAGRGFLERGVAGGDWCFLQCHSESRSGTRDLDFGRRRDSVHDARRHVVGRLHRHLSTRPGSDRYVGGAPVGDGSGGRIGGLRRQLLSKSNAKRAGCCHRSPPEAIGRSRMIVSWWDTSLMLIFGGIPWNCYFQRVLSCRDPVAARWHSIVAGGLTILLTIPPLLLGDGRGQSLSGRTRRVPG